MRAYICIGIMCVACLFSFWLGRNMGMAQSREKVQKEVAVMDVIEQESTETDVEEPESTETGAQEPESTETGVEEPESTEAGAQEPESTETGVEEPESTEAGAQETESTDIDKSSILLVNKVNKLPEDYEVVLKHLPDGTNRAAEEAYEPMCNMLEAARADGMYLEICSSYRSVNRQKQLFEEDMASFISKGYSYVDAYDATAKYTMPPGYSEHATGLAFDIVALNYQMLNSKQATTPENKWLQEHCAEYGFILRYPKGKEDITGVAYESWHFRYVGVEAAGYIMKEGLTLEEFLEQ